LVPENSPYPGLITSDYCRSRTLTLVNSTRPKPSAADGDLGSSTGMSIRCSMNALRSQKKAAMLTKGQVPKPEDRTILYARTVVLVDILEKPDVALR
jgi:hypothetical protein